MSFFKIGAGLAAALSLLACSSPGSRQVSRFAPSADYLGQPFGANPRLQLSIEGDRLVLRGARAAPAQVATSAVPGQFRPELWRADCVELFLANPDNGYYLELNLSPNGSWWACLFRAPLKRSQPEGFALLGTIAQGRVSPERWDCSLSIPLASLPPEISFAPGKTRYNLSCCIGDDKIEQRYASLAPLPAGPANFHCPSHWLPLP